MTRNRVALQAPLAALVLVALLAAPQWVSSPVAKLPHGTGSGTEASEIRVPEGTTFDVDARMFFPGIPVFGPVFRLDDDPTGHEDRAPALAVGPNGTVHAVWADGRPAPYSVHYSTVECCAPRRSIQVDDVVPPGFAFPEKDSLRVAPNGTVHAAWHHWTIEGGEALYSLRNATDSAFAPTEKANDPATGRAGTVVMALAEDGTVAIAFNKCPAVEVTSCDLFVALKPPREPFGPPIRVNDDEGQALQVGPSLAVDGRELHVAWTDYRAGYQDIYYAVLNLDTEVVTPNIRVYPEPTGWRWGADIAIDPAGSILVVWTEQRPDFDSIFGAVRRPGETEFGPAFPLNDVVENTQNSPAAAVLGNDAFFVVWKDLRQGVFDVYGTLVVGGRAQSNVEITDAQSKFALDPVVAAGAGRIAVAWSDDPTGDRNVYARLATLGGTFTWDLRPDIDADGNGNATDDGDFKGPVLSTVYGDDGTYEVVLTVRDGATVLFSRTIAVQISNESPSLEAQVTGGGGPAALTFVISGEKWHDVIVTVFREGAAIAGGKLVRTPGSPMDQALDLGTHPAWTEGELVVVAQYSPEDDPRNGQAWGATPARLLIGDPSNPEVVLHHTFNARYPETWEWTAAPQAPAAAGDLVLELHLWDPGTDDLFLEVDWGDGTVEARELLHDPSGPDPPRSPEGTPRDIVLVLSHSYQPGSFPITVSVRDDDGGTTLQTIEVP